MKLLDVTFRESVLCSNFIGVNDVLNTIKKLAQTSIDYIEIGYLKSNVSGNPLVNYNAAYINECHKICNKKAKIVAMMHPQDFAPQIYEEKVIKKLSLIRITADSDNFDMTKDIVDYFKALDVKVSINLVRSSKYSDEECSEYCSRASALGADIFYIADSNGHFLPHQVKRLITTLKNSSSAIEIGFHAHNNLGLAIINAIEAMQAGVDIIDSSLLGYGKGAGNLQTELFPVVRGRVEKIENIDEIYSFFKVAQYFYHNVTKPNPFEEKYKFALYGLYNIDLPFDKELSIISASKGIQDHELAFNYIKECNGDTSKLHDLLNLSSQ
jgi:4-hydroxy 2-oxovalerate aldolase